MGRIEDDEADRAERLRQERKLQEQQQAKRALAEHEQFQAYVRKAGETKKQQDQGDNQKNEANQNARQTLLARRGIDNNERQNRVFADGAKSNAVNRERLINDGRLQQRRGEDAPRPPLGGQPDTRGTKMGVKGGAKGQDDGQNRGDEQRRQAPRAAGTALPQATFAAIGQAAVQALDGMGARTGTSQGVAAADKLRQMLEEIVAGVRQGLAEGGKTAFMEITLNGDTLGGTRLTVLSTEAGIHLKIDTNEQGPRRSDRPIESLLTSSATELSHAMAAAKVKLIGLEVNGEKVIA